MIVVEDREPVQSQKLRLSTKKMRGKPEFHYKHTSHNNGGKSDRGPDHGNRRLVSLVTNKRVLTILHCIWKDIVATLAFILTPFVANRLRGSTQIIVSEFYTVFGTLSTGDRGP